MSPELKTASRIICERLRQRPYQRGVTITAWSAVIEQLLNGSRCGAFSWHKAVETEIRNYIAELDETTRRRIWELTEDAKIIPSASIDAITHCLYPFFFNATRPRIFRAVRNRRRKQDQTKGGGSP